MVSSVWDVKFKALLLHDIYTNNLYPKVHFTLNQDRNKWNNINTDNLKGFVGKIYKNTLNKKIYIRITKIGGTKHIDSTLIYDYKSNGYKKIYGDIESKGLQADISLVDNEVYFILGNKIATRQNNKFKTLLNVDNQNFYQRIWGRNSKDIFLLMTDGLAHYNGDNVEYLFHFKYAEEKPWTQIFGGVLFEKDVFFTAYEPLTHLKLIYHGKLK